MQTQSTEDYIKGIYKLRREGKQVTTSALARHLGVEDGSVTDMVKKLSEKKLVHYKPYQGVALTEAGLRIAIKTMRRHRLWEMFLAKFLSYSWDEVHDEAERLEHVTSDEMERRLDRALGYPKTDPHGDPIPTSDGEVAATKYAPLSEFDPGETAVIMRVSDADPEVLQYLARLGLGLRSRVSVREKMSVDGTMIIRVGKKDRFISHKLAAAISARKSG